MAKRNKMTDEEIKDLVLSESSKATGSQYGDDELLENRRLALKYYYGESLGDEIEGSSQVVSMDVADSVDAMLTQLMPIFGGDNIVQFEPIEEQDEEQARIESNFVNHVVMEQNNGYMLFETLIKDCLLSKNAIAKVRVERDVDVEKEKYEGLTEEELFIVMQPRNPDNQEEIDVTDFDQANGNVSLTRTTTALSLKIDAVAPENFAVTNEQNEVDLADCTYCREKYYATRSELQEAGFKKSIVDSLVNVTSETQIDAVERNTVTSERNFYHTNPSMQIMEVEEHYIRVDRDGDGLAELLKVVTVERTLLDIEEVDVIPYASGVAYLNGHRFYGQSVFDKLKNVQDIKTHFLRQWSDNALANNHNKSDVIEDQVNMEDFLNGRPNAVRRMDSLDSARDVIPHDIGPSCENALNYWDKVRTDRTGSSLSLQANQVAMPSNVGDQGVNTLVANLEKVTGLISKNFSETLVTSLYQLTHTFLRVNFPNQIQARMTGQWANTNPSEWRERKQINITIPATPTERIQQQVALEKAINIAMAEQQAGMMGITTDLNNIYQMRVDMLRLAGIPRPEKYLVNPASPQSQQAQQSQAQQAQAQQQEAQQDKQFAMQMQMGQVQAMSDEVKRNSIEDVARLELDLFKMQSDNKFSYDQLVTGMQSEGFKQQSDNSQAEGTLTFKYDELRAKGRSELMSNGQDDKKIQFDYDKLLVDAQNKDKDIESSEEIAEAKMVSDAQVKMSIEELKGLNGAESKVDIPDE